ncbi:fatty acid desaturase family protein [Actinopolyspora mortivallis]|uniref:fatty acid desaturase family protein n=1 Tax=Actinopolyspora mortivallis TaxID=33906 RepID=UPI00039D999E|nr:fatty acid desaturase family protein [Actinopolyspora mortivallis]
MHTVEQKSMTADTRYKRGYTAPESARSAIKAAHRTSPWISAATAGLDIVVVVASTIGCGILGSHIPFWGVPFLVVVGALIVARFCRGLENLVHEGSHFNWSRHDRRLNDALVLAAAVPVGAGIGAYRLGHLRHHGKFGTSADPDLARYVELDLEGIERSSRAAYLRGLVARFGRYQLGWLREVSSGPYVVVAPFCWALLLIVLPSAVLGGLGAAWLSGLTWALGFLVLLPFLRMIAESSEHVYSDADTVFDATVSNIGFLQRAVLHPHNDGYHTLHHMWPGVPHHRIARLHRFLVRNDPAGYGATLRYRTGVRQNPVRSSGVGGHEIREKNSTI